MEQRKRDDAKAGAASGKVVPLWRTTVRQDLPRAYLEQIARRTRANLTDLVATAGSYNLDLATKFRIAAELLQKPSGTSDPLRIADFTGLRLTNEGCRYWELADQNGDVVLYSTLERKDV